MELEAEVRKAALKNAFEHSGKADKGSVISKLLGQFPEYRSKTREIMPVIGAIVDQINSLRPEEIEEMINREFPEFLVKEKKVQVHRLPDLRNVQGRVVMRMAPSPSGPLNVGHSRMAILNDEYVKRYGGELILRIEDTNPSNIDPISYEQIPEDLKYIEVNVTKMVIQSDRMKLYYEEARRLLSENNAYICTCDPEDFKRKLSKSVACPHRDAKPEVNLDLFEKILDGKFKPGEAVMVVKTDLEHPNPSVRDWIAFRISEAMHPRHGNEFRFYPLMNFGVAIDDHLLGLTHIIRGKDHINNTEKQRYIFNYNKWQTPEYYHYGLIHFPTVILKTSIIKKGIASGAYSGWDDVRLGTLLAFKKRGFSPATFRRYWIESGMREIDSEFSAEIFNSMNKELIDFTTRRYFFVPEERRIRIDGFDPIHAMAPYHPSNPALGQRTYDMKKNPDVFIPSTDWDAADEGNILRLKDLCNVKKSKDGVVFQGTAPLGNKVKIIQWCPAESGDFVVHKPDGTSDSGKIEPLSKGFRGVAQLERYGYVNIMSDTEGYLTHK